MAKPRITVIGGGLAGAEAAWAAAQQGCEVALWEMRPDRMTAAHRTGDLAELVCSNSLKSDLLTNASGILKAEMRRLGSLVLSVAERCRVPAGEALAVDRDAFAQGVTRAIEGHAGIEVVRREVEALPDAIPVVVATGPLTSDALAHSLRGHTGNESLYFYDAVAPTVTVESIDHDRVYRASRRQRGSTGETAAGGDYLNCPLTREQFLAFHAALLGAEQAPLHTADECATPFFEMCLPIEELARRGPRTLAYGPMRPIGLEDPRTGKRPYAVVQLRQENAAGTLWGLVGFQTRLRWPEQKRVLRLVPGLERAQFVRYGVMHRSTYVNSPRVLRDTCELRGRAGVFLAGQITGVEGYVESAATGILAGINAARNLMGQPTVTPPPETVLGSLCRYLVDTDPERFAPMNANLGIIPELPGSVRNKRERSRLKGERALRSLERWLASELAG
ncbi:MAG TPA: methylenetetrahydrofolate--tRNA-(uracil(54)-C(5))-methyltransferase (FADH(2)-oxidizing) TrmFO [Chthonomonadales bacterium]|nr:methylenetetrahydrofolate--tRNA-(uracil(54)-C(5))-methyltransferase (FADH(2)-oxidizing) TrmFO [Chthonomonadales bacterium]